MNVLVCVYVCVAHSTEIIINSIANFPNARYHWCEKAVRKICASKHIMPKDVRAIRKAINNFAPLYCSYTVCYIAPHLYPSAANFVRICRVFGLPRAAYGDRYIRLTQSGQRFTCLVCTYRFWPKWMCNRHSCRSGMDCRASRVLFRGFGADHPAMLDEHCSSIVITWNIWCCA